MAAKAKAVDWAGVEIDYRAGVLTDRAVGSKYGISHGAVQKRAKAEGWDRDLSGRIEKRRQSKVARSIVAKKGSQATPATEQQVVEANAEAQTQVILGERKDIQALSETVIGLAAELKAVSNRELQDALELVLDEKTDQASQAYKTALTKAFNAAIALGGRSNAARNIVQSYATLMDKRHQAYGIDKDSSGQKSLGEWLEALS